MKISEQESREMREESLRKGVSFSDAQWAKVIHAVEERLTRAERKAEKELADKVEQLKKQHQRELAQMLSQAEALQAAATKVKALIDSAHQYEAMRQAHFEGTDKQDSGLA